jgi:hypothetical protein
MWWKIVLILVGLGLLAWETYEALTTDTLGVWDLVIVLVGFSLLSIALYQVLAKPRPVGDYVFGRNQPSP